MWLLYCLLLNDFFFFDSVFWDDAHWRACAENEGIVECVLLDDAEPLCRCCEEGHHESRYWTTITVRVRQSVRFRDFPLYFRPRTGIDMYDPNGHGAIEYVRSKEIAIRWWSAQGDVGEKSVVLKFPGTSGGWACILYHEWGYNKDKITAGFQPLTAGEIKRRRLEDTI